MRSRLICALAASIVCAVACGGGAFSGVADDGSSGSGATAGSSGGSKAQGGSSKGGSSKGGGSSAGNSSAGDVSSGGSAPGGGVVGTSGTGMTGESGAPIVVVQCSSPSDCDVDSACQEPTCNSNECGKKDLPNGPFQLQVPGDCQRMDCLDGAETLVADAGDNDDNNECTEDSCTQAGSVLHKARYGVVCANGAGVCSAAGKCELCSRDACADPAPCKMAICEGGQCHLANRPAGELCNLTPNDPIDPNDQCDGNGVCIDCVDNGGCGECCACANNGCQ